MSSAKDWVAVVSALSVYRRKIVPLVRGRQRLSEAAAARIPDPVLREAALTSLQGKGRNAEATAVFAILAPREHRPEVVRAITDLQTAIDFLDTLGELPATAGLAGGLQLHRALEAAVSPAASASDWYRHCAHSDDGDYLENLVVACRREIGALPAKETVIATAIQAARRCGEGQSHTHAGAGGEELALRKWAGTLPDHADYSWWELAAAASSSVAVHALIAAAADDRTDSLETERIDAAYFPSIGALTVLLDDLIDLDDDRANGEHNYLAHYSSNAVAAERLTRIVGEAQTAVAELRDPHRHRAILIGVVGFYLSNAAARSEYARPIRSRLLGSIGAPVLPVLAAMRVLGHD
jgi:tetraprenyl-beta-curcumene synthase